MYLIPHVSKKAATFHVQLITQPTILDEAIVLRTEGVDMLSLGLSWEEARQLYAVLGHTLKVHEQDAAAAAIETEPLFVA